MNGESPLIDTSVLIDYFEGIDCPENTVLDTLIVTMAHVAGCALLTRDGRQKDLARFLKVKLR
jgi:predicted nucleic acid-binding protein